MNGDYKKIVQIFNYLAQKEGGQINYMKAIKLMYLSDRLHLRKYGRLITGDALVGMKNGALGSLARDIVTLNKERLPYNAFVYAEDKIEKENYNIISKIESLDELSDTDIECVDSIYSTFSRFTQYELGDLTHELPEYIEVEPTIVERNFSFIKIENLFAETQNDLLHSVYNQTPEEIKIAREIYLDSKEEDFLFA